MSYSGERDQFAPNMALVPMVDQVFILIIPLVMPVAELSLQMMATHVIIMAIRIFLARVQYPSPLI